MSGPQFGPGGYLPPKAAKRARKIVLREQMGFGWPVAAVCATLLVGVAGVVFLRTATRPPGAPYVALGPLTEVDESGAAVMDGPGEQAALVVRAGGPVRAFAAGPADIGWCARSGRIETSDAAWTADGRLVAGTGDSLQPLRSVVFDGVVYVDFSTPLPRPAPLPGGDPPACDPNG